MGGREVADAGCEDYFQCRSTDRVTLYKATLIQTRSDKAAGHEIGEAGCR